MDTSFCSLELWEREREKHAEEQHHFGVHFTWTHGRERKHILHMNFAHKTKNKEIRSLSRNVIWKSQTLITVEMSKTNAVKQTERNKEKEKRRFFLLAVSFRTCLQKSPRCFMPFHRSNHFNCYALWIFSFHSSIILLRAHTHTPLFSCHRPNEK